MLQSPCCQICSKKFASTVAVLEHLYAAHPSASLASFVTSQKGCSLLVHNNYIYVLKASSKHINNHHWACKDRGCPGRALTHGSTYNDVTSVVKSFERHSHPPSATSVKLYEALERLHQQALESNASPFLLRQQLLSAVEPEVAALLPSTAGVARRVVRWRQKARRDPEKGKEAV